MPESWPGLGLVQWLYEHRTAPATALFQGSTLLGEIEGYVLVVSLIFVAYDKGLAFRLAALVLVAMSLNHLLKILIANPRPFVAEGTFAEKWAVSAERAQELATEYSTPSGHAMAGSAFYGFLLASVRSRPVRAAAIAAILLTGLSRPYLGVHYLEDVLLGWALGIPIAVFAWRFREALASAWGRRSLPARLAIVFAASLALWLVTRAQGDPDPEAPPLAFVSYTGFLAGIVLAFPLEARWVGFDPRSASAPRKVLRFALCVALVMSTLLLLDPAFGLLASDASLAGQALRYLRYALAAVAGILLGPFLFVRLGLAEATPLRHART
jgi:membrane-associated phospholipid phosphatase